MKRYFLLVFICVASLASAESSLEVDTHSGGEAASVESDIQELIWVGPGWYGGIWFEDEIEFDEWIEYRHQHRNDQDLYPG